MREKGWAVACQNMSGGKFRDEADEAYSVTEQLTMTGINRIRQKINVHGIPVYLCEACGNPIPEARRKIFPGVTLCVECQAYQERQRKHYA